jgi:predicted flap endonuclease-1-like 5' DNA nuclease
VRSADVQRLNALLADLMSCRTELAERVAELRRVLNERNEVQARLIRVEHAERELSTALRAEQRLRADLVATHAQSSAALRARVAELESQLENVPELELKLVHLEQKLLESADKSGDSSFAACKALPKAESGPAELRTIRGIGPSYERALRALGITTVAQIALLSAEDLARIGPSINVRVERIVREDWVGQAQRLRKEGR